MPATVEIRAANHRRGRISLRQYRAELARALSTQPRGEWLEGAVEDDFHGSRRVLAELARVHDMDPDEVAENLADSIHNARRVNVELAALPVDVRPRGAASEECGAACGAEGHNMSNS